MDRREGVRVGERNFLHRGKCNEKKEKAIEIKVEILKERKEEVHYILSQILTK